jgi:cellulose synthase/poly-beta-1,6-N-acetylglucosamine synthase-like glycosyltransferase
MYAVIDVVLGLAAIPVLLVSAYLLLLTLASARRPPPPAAPPHLRFDVVVPAHDEEAGIATTVRSLLALDYPAELRRVIVVADNCGDATAERAAAAGARVLTRRDPERRGKGYALEFAFERCLAEGVADAVVVVDADTEAGPGLLRAFSARIDAGAAAVQGDYVVSNPRASWRTCLMTIAFALFNSLRSLGRERLGLSTGLRGNGMCFTVEVLRQVPHQAFSIVEDLEYGIRLGLAGHRVHFAPDAQVRSAMLSEGGASGSQRRRWEGGRREMARRHAWPLVRRGLATPDRVLLDLGLDLLVPPLAYVGGAAAGGALLSGLVTLLAGRPVGAPWAWAASLAALAAYLVRGWWLSGTGAQGVVALLYAPVFLAWKIGVTLRRPSAPRGEWVRTHRESGGGPGRQD